jgi:hypothetical protein
LGYNIDNGNIKGEIMLSQNMITSLAKKHKVSMDRICQIADLCEQYGVRPTGDVFRKTPEDFEKIMNICKAEKINPEEFRTMFARNVAVIQEIIDICHENNMKLKPVVFGAKPDKFRESIAYIKSNFGSRYVDLHIAMRDVEKLKESMPVMRTLGLLPYTLHDASVFDLTRDEILERTGCLRYLGVKPHKVTRYIQVDRIDRIYTLSKSAFEDYCYVNCIPASIRKYHKEQLDKLVREFEERKNVK